jgi:hypothetical protein
MGDILTIKLPYFGKSVYKDHEAAVTNGGMVAYVPHDAILAVEPGPPKIGDEVTWKKISEPQKKWYKYVVCYTWDDYAVVKQFPREGAIGKKTSLAVYKLSKLRRV